MKILDVTCNTENDDNQLEFERAIKNWANKQSEAISFRFFHEARENSISAQVIVYQPYTEEKIAKFQKSLTRFANKYANIQ